MKALLLSSVLSLSVVVLLSCENIFEQDDYKELVEKIDINPSHELNPPIVKNIFLEKLKENDSRGNNLNFMAEFEAGTVKGEYLAMLLNDQKIVLRDDGKGADKKAGDHIFSVHINQDLDELEQEFEARKELLLSNQGIAVFKNRSFENREIDKVQGFNIKDLLQHEVLQIPLDFLHGILGLSDQKKTLMITDLSVVEDPARTFNPCTSSGTPNGVWTFGEAMRQMASPNPSSIATDLQVSNFVRNWMDTWMSNQTVNGEVLPARNTIQGIISEWESKSGVGSGGILNMRFAPFKLIAIVNRLDLRGNSGYGFSNAGEGRLVFNAMDSTCDPLRFTVIFEYGINKRTCNAVKAFAQEWKNLNSMILGSPAYNAALQNITDQFIPSGTNPAKPNQNSINQIRTNEIALGAPWELREFNLHASGQLSLVTVKQEPAVKYNVQLNNLDVERLVRFINDNELNIENNKYTVPENVPLNAGATTPTTPFLGGKSHTDFPPTGIPPNVHHWNGTTTPGPAFISSDLARHVFSLNTCSGCHGGETQTFFTHIEPSPFGTEASLSGFLTGISVLDAANRPTGSPTTRSFNDLQRREMDLDNLVNNTCISIPMIDLAQKLRFEPIRMVH